MGACCSNEGKENRVDLKEENLNAIGLNKESQIDEYTTKPQFNNANEITSPEYVLFKETAEKLRGESEVTTQLYERRGPYDYEPMAQDGAVRELRELQQVENNAQYYGFWNTATNLRDGSGVMIWPDGSRYDGTWVNNKANGKGRLIHADGDIYEGQWENDKANGKGTYIHQDGAVYEGDWENEIGRAHV